VQNLKVSLLLFVVTQCKYFQIAKAGTAHEIELHIPDSVSDSDRDRITDILYILICQTICTKVESFVAVFSVTQ